MGNPQPADLDLESYQTHLTDGSASEWRTATQKSGSVNFAHNWSCNGIRACWLGLRTDNGRSERKYGVAISAMSLRCLLLVTFNNN
jgi:hypothetical protein